MCQLKPLELPEVDSEVTRIYGAARTVAPVACGAAPGGAGARASSLAGGGTSSGESVGRQLLGSALPPPKCGENQVWTAPDPRHGGAGLRRPHHGAAEAHKANQEGDLHAHHVRSGGDRQDESGQDGAGLEANGDRLLRHHPA
ncbi:unnamed protein product [Phytophthora lilii]|uniref:Unnamed protein product n=1 Tax=Phytophthora lilii TaxID=2077276 RepID=A0A9W6U5Q4_9STRA|nr:unnamed protein product [Phytophthora lilii]